jgi:hypothetical protein
MLHVSRAPGILALGLIAMGSVAMAADKGAPIFDGKTLKRSSTARP